MSHAEAVAGMDRLPWLPDEPTPTMRRSHIHEFAGWAATALVLVAGVSYWMGAHSWEQPVARIRAAQPATTVPLPQARPVEPEQPQVLLEPPPEVTPAPQREVPIARPKSERPVVRTPTLERKKPTPAPVHRAPVVAAAPVSRAAPPAPATVPKPLTAWPAWESQGAAGRIVRIGAFGTRLQAKLGWRYMVRAYPAVAHLQATVVEVRNSHRRTFYRFQIGTTSQAHSEVLCQRMEKIRLSCAVVGLPWKPAGVER